VTDTEDDELKFDVALLQALESAEQVELAHKELRQEISSFASAVKHATQDQVTATISAGKRRTPWGVIASFTVALDHNDPEETPPQVQSVLMVAHREGRIPWEETREICRVVASDTGYPFQIDGPQGIVFAEDKEGLHSALYEAIRHPRTGSKMKGLIQQLKRDKSADSSGG
jgi:hypothetical protein